jgi:peptide/nickel transport system permease protein
LQTPESDLSKSTPTLAIRENRWSESGWRRGVRTIRQSKNAMAGFAMVILLLSLVVLGPILAPYSPGQQDLRNRHVRPGNSEHLLGTDHLGRDTLSRILYGARISLSLSIGAIALAVLIGVPVGLLAGYRGGSIIDNVISGLNDVLLAFPTYLLAIFIVAVLGPTLVNITVAVGLSTLPNIVRIVRGDTLGVRSLDMILAARAIGARTPRILGLHILPNIMGSIAVVATLRLGTAVLVESSLAFLGLGLSPPTPAWGLMINEGLRYLGSNPWLAVLPGLAIMLTVLGFNLFGDGLRDALDPRTR